MPKTVWKKLESWKPYIGTDAEGPLYKVIQRPFFRANCVLRTARNAIRTFNSRAAALTAANKQNRMEGLPEVQ